MFVTDKGERFEVPEGQMRWKRPLGKKVVLIDTDTRLDASHENTLLNECPPYYPTLPGRTAGHMNHYLYGTLHRLLIVCRANPVSYDSRLRLPIGESS